MQTVSNRQNTNTNRDCCLHPVRSPLQSQDWTLYSLFKGTAQIITHLHFEQGGEDKRDRERNWKSGRGNVLLETSFVVYSYWSMYMYLHVLYCCHQKYRDVGKPFLKGLFFFFQNCLQPSNCPLMSLCPKADVICCPAYEVQLNPFI